MDRSHVRGYNPPRASGAPKCYRGIMSHLNVEIKVRCRRPSRIRKLLRQQNADFRGVDLQVDTYFKVPAGRGKLREGKIEHSLIHYERPNRPGPKVSRVRLYQVACESKLKDVLAAALGALAVVKKSREIYFIDNVKFHIDRVENLGSFVEIEAIDATGRIGRQRLLKQCRRYMTLFGIRKSDLIDCSYSDMLLARRAAKQG